jgi:nucleotide-binding universal stress UspA family protein
MGSLKKILLPTDLSKRSVDGLMMAYPLAAEKGAVLILLHVVSKQRIEEFSDTQTVLGEIRSPRWTVDRIIQEAALDLSCFVEQHQELLRIPVVRKKVLFGEVSQRIIEEAGKEAVDLVIITPCAHKRLRGFFCKSVTDQIIREAPCPVLLVSSSIKKGRWWGKLVPSLTFLLRRAAATI